MNLGKDTLPLLRETWQDFQNDEAGTLGAALAYYAMFSIFPLLIILVSVFGLILRSLGLGVTIESEILRVVEENFGQNMHDIIQGMLQTVESRANLGLGIGLITLLFGASGVFQQLDASFNKIWKAPKKTESSGIMVTITTALREKLFSFGMVLAVGFLMLISLILTGVSRSLLSVLQDVPVVGGAFGYITGLLITLMLSTLVFALLFKYLPNTQVRWSDVWLGALLTAILWEIAKRLLALYIDFTSRSFSAYGAIGTLLVVMIWVYFSSQVLFLGAEFTEVYSRQYGSRAPRPEPELEPPAPTPSPQPTPAPAPLPTLAPSPIPHSSGATHSTGVIAVATGAGLLVGALGTLLAGVVAVIIGARRAAASVASVARWAKRAK